jgi:uncharacterized membrane-anchored protein
MKASIEAEGVMPFQSDFNKIPKLTLAFWLIQIMSTTVGETIANFLSVAAGWGLGVTCGVMVVLFAVVLFVQLRTRHCIPFIYWLTVVLASMVGSQMTDVLTDKLGINLYVSTAVFVAILTFIFVIWCRVERTLSMQEIFTPRSEWFYWTAILITFTLGTSVGDLAMEVLGLGFKWGVVVFGAMITLTFIAWRLTGNEVVTFWVGYILTHPFSAAFGDLLMQSELYGGLGLGFVWSSALLLSVIFALAVLPASILEPSDGSLQNIK